MIIIKNVRIHQKIDERQWYSQIKNTEKSNRNVF